MSKDDDTMKEMVKLFQDENDREIREVELGLEIELLIEDEEDIKRVKGGTIQITSGIKEDK